MTERSPRLSCFVPPTPPLIRGGAPRLLRLATKPSPHLHFALQGRFAPTPRAYHFAPDEANAWGFAVLPMPGSHQVLLHTDGTVLVFVWRDDHYSWLPFALHSDVLRPSALAGHGVQLARETLRWVAAWDGRATGFGPDLLLPLHHNTNDPWAHLPMAHIGGQRVLRANSPELDAFFGVARAFLERHKQASDTLPFPTLWNSLDLRSGMLDQRGGWTLKPHLGLGFPSRNGTFATRALRKAWKGLSTAFVDEVLARGTLPTSLLAGWWWNTSTALRTHRSPFNLMLASSGGDNPAAQGLAHGLSITLSAHARLRPLAAFQAAAPDTYAAWTST